MEVIVYNWIFFSISHMILSFGVKIEGINGTLSSKQNLWIAPRRKIKEQHLTGIMAGECLLSSVVGLGGGMLL